MASKRVTTRRSVLAGVATAAVGSAGAAAARQGSGSESGAGAAPANVPDVQFLDATPEHVADVVVDDVPHSIYRLAHRVLAADGVEVYARGERLTGAAAVREPFLRLAWREGVAAHVEPATRTRLTDMRDVAADVRAVLGPVADALDRVVGVIDRLRSTGYADVTAWELVTSVAPSVGLVAEAVAAAEGIVSNWESVASDAVTAVVDLESSFGGLAAPSDQPDTFYDRSFRERFGAASTAVHDVALDTALVYDRIVDVRERADEAAAAVEDGVDAILEEAPSAFPGDELRDLAAATASALEAAGAAVVDAASPVESFRDEMRALDETLDAVKHDADRRSSSLTEAWHARSDAPARVNSAAALTGLVALYLVSTGTTYTPGTVDWPIDPPFDLEDR